MIEVKDLDFSYSKEDHAIKGISFNIEDGSFISIIGHNGSGKSTLSKLLIGLIYPKSGHIIIDGEELTEKSAPKLRKKIGIVFQNPDNQFVGVNVKYDIAFGLENNLVEHDLMHELVEEYADKVGMKDFLEREPESLSGGQKQRVAIAGILALNKDIIILDEATSMLDPEGTKEITDLIKELKDKYHKTIISITHDLNLASLSDRVIVLKEGNIILDGTPDEVFKEKDLLLSSNLKMPFYLELKSKIESDDTLKNNESLMESICQLSLKM